MSKGGKDTSRTNRSANRTVEMFAKPNRNALRMTYRMTHTTLGYQDIGVKNTFFTKPAFRLF
jgi:hypothetical protein